MSDPVRPPNRSAAYFDVYWKQRFNSASYRRRLNSLRLNYSAHLPVRHAQVLEIGPGFGEMLELLRDNGVDRVEAIDIDVRLVEALHARGFLSVQAVQNTVDYLRTRPAAFDCVIALHVLEHFLPTDGSDLLRAVFASLAPGGRVIVEVPNMANFITAPYARWADYTHRTGFTQESLATALWTAGFEVVKTFGIARPIRSPVELAAWLGQTITQSIVWTLLKANYSQSRIVASPAIAAVGFKSSGVG